MIKGKKYIATLLTIAAIFSITEISMPSAVKAANINYNEEDYLYYHEGKDNNGLTWQYINNDDGTITLTGTSDLSSNIDVPSEVNGHKVTGIQSVVRFYYFSSGKIDEERAIKDGQVVTNVTLPDTLESFLDSLKYCSNVKDINMPKSVKRVKVFNTSQKWIDKYRNSDGLIIINNILVNGENAKGKISIPDNVVEIADSAFAGQDGKGSKITEIMIPNSVKKIGEYAFIDCNNIEEITIPGSVKTIGRAAFMGCENLKKVKIEKGVKEIQESAFFACSSLSDLEIPDDVDVIYPDAFERCDKLENKPNKSTQGLSIDDSGVLYSAYGAEGDVVIPDSVKEIKDGVFGYNSRITSVTISGNTKVIGASAFRGCSNLKHVTLGEGIEKIEDEAFLGTALEKVKIPKSIEEFGKDIFLNCASLKEASNRDGGLIVTKNGVLCSGLFAEGNVVIPQDVNEIQNYAFFGNKNINSVRITGNVKKIGNAAFQQCDNLTKVTIDEGLRDIEKYAFYYCGNLSSVILPDSLQTIGNYAFGDCPKLSSVSYKEGLDFSNSFEGTPWNANRTNDRGKTSTDTNNKPTGTVSDWQCIDGKWYYINADGSKQKGWFFDIRYGKWYFLDENDGVRQTGWKYYAPYNSWFYLDPYDGARISGWFYDPSYGSWFFMNDNGTMKVGWMYDYNYGAWFYLNGNGTMRTGWFYDNSDGNWYYLYSNGVMARSTYVGGYYVNSSGAWVY